MDFLDYLTEQLGCAYLSDLHYIAITPEQVETILMLPDEPFGLEDYRMAIDYLTGGCPAFSTKKEARRVLTQAFLRHSQS